MYSNPILEQIYLAAGAWVYSDPILEQIYLAASARVILGFVFIQNILLYQDHLYRSGLIGIIVEFSASEIWSYTAKVYSSPFFYILRVTSKISSGFNV